MAFQRAQWHSGLTYRQVCHTCKVTVEYKDDVLDFRPWYADGFVYCPRCKTPLRHNENFAINGPVGTVPTVVDNEVAAFCTGCGSPFKADDRFCAKCGRKR